MGPDKRKINYLRISVTDRCNFRCRYCIPKKSSMLVHHNQIPTYEEILRIVHLATDTGIDKVRITGGEPFVRRGITSFLEKLCRINQLTDISVTTNGSILNPEKLKHLFNIGIQRINISLDTLNPEKFKYISGKDAFDEVMNNILTALDTGFNPVKINTVILRNINDDEIEALASLTFQYPFHVRFIEYMPMGNFNIRENQRVLAPEIKNRLSALAELIPVKKNFNDGPAQRFKLKNAKGEIGFITPFSSHFCHDCNRIRLTATGALRPCLLNDYQINILRHMRQGASEIELKAILLQAVRQKPASHTLGLFHTTDISSQMSTIGG